MIKRNYILVFAICIITSCISTEQTKQTDVLVIGGTTSGISVGLQSARLNVPTLIVEETPWLGGMMTADGVSVTDGNYRLNSEIWNKFRAHYGSEDALSTGWMSNTQFEPHIDNSIFKLMVLTEKHLSVIYGYHLTGIVKDMNYR